MSTLQDVHKWTTADCVIDPEIAEKVRRLVLARAGDSAEMILNILGLA